MPAPNKKDFVSWMAYYEAVRWYREGQHDQWKASNPPRVISTPAVRPTLLGRLFGARLTAGQPIDG